MSKSIAAKSKNIIQKYKIDMNNTIKLDNDDVKQFINAYREHVDEKWVDLDAIYNHIKNTIPESITPNDFYNYVADYCATKISVHPDYNKLASRICINRLHNTTYDSMSKVAQVLFDNVDMHGVPQPLITQDLYNTIMNNKEQIENAMNNDDDYSFDYFGIRTLERSYLLKMNDDSNKKVPMERPQQMIMRVALGIHGNDIDAAIETYKLMSQKYFTHATPTLFNAGTNRNQLSSCFLLGVDDNLDNIFSQIKQIGMISKYAGGIGIHMSSIRAKGSLIRGTNGESGGIIPLCIVLNKTSRYVDQGGGKRKGSIACYLEPWHADIFEYCELRKANSGNEDTRARDLFLALWIPDLFMKRVENDGMWSLMCPDECPNLNGTYGDEFEQLYLKYESAKQYRKQVYARDLWKHIMECQIETGFPYMLYKDSVNKKSNQKNLGTIKSSNLCVHGDTYVLTDMGQKKISTLVETFVNVWNGNEWSNVLVKKTGANIDLIRVNLSNGAYLDCTKNHIFYCKNENGHIVGVEAQNLEYKMELIQIPLLPVVNTKTNEYDSLMCSSTEEKFEWLRHYGNIDGNEMCINCDNYEGFNVARLMLQTIGIDTYCTLFTKDSEKAIYQLKIDAYGMYNLAKMGFEKINENHNVNINWDCSNSHTVRKPKQQENIVYVTCIEPSFESCDTYCFTEPKRGLGMFNGILTGQCAEITEYSDGNTTAVCNLASICLPKYIEEKDGKKYFNYKKLIEIVRVIVRNLNKVIDINYYPTDNAKSSNETTRPIGIGIQGQACLFNLMSYSYDSPEAALLNKRVFETIYYAAVDESKELAKRDGHYELFKGSPMSEGKLQFHLWGLDVKDLETKHEYDWDKLIQEVVEFGVRNSLLTALMPTASTSQIMKCYESFEPYMSNVFVRTTIAGEFIVVNEHLVKDLLKLNLWSDDMKKKIIIANGSVQNIPEIPQHLKDVYKTAFELKLKSILKQSVERGPFIDQSQSMNLFMDKPDFTKLTSAHFYGWKSGLKTGMYYLRSLPAVNPIQFGIDISELMRLTGNTNAIDMINANYNIEQKQSKQTNNDDFELKVCKRGKKGTPDEGCLVCSA